MSNAIPRASKGLRVLPTRKRLDEETLRQHTQGGAFSESLITWRDLCLRLASTKGRRRPINATGARLLLRQIIAAFDASPLLAPVLKTSGFVEALYAFIGSCKGAGVAPQNLMEFAKVGGHNTLLELAQLYAFYVDSLKKGVQVSSAIEGLEPIPFSDEWDHLQDGVDALNAGAPLPDIFDPENVPFVIIQDPLDLTVAQGQLLMALAQRLAEHTQALILLVPDFENREDIQTNWEERLNAAIPLAEREAITVLTYPLKGGAGPLTTLKNRLFNQPSNQKDPDFPDDSLSGECLSIMEGPTLASEIRAVIGKLKALLLAGVSPEAIAIAAPQWSTYVNPLQRLMDAAGLRWTGPSDPPLALSPVARVGLEIVHLVRNGWPRDDLLALIGGGKEGQLVGSRSLFGPDFKDGSKVALLLKRSGAQREPLAHEQGDGYRIHLEAFANHLTSNNKEKDAAEALKLADACEALFKRFSPLGENAPLSLTATRLRTLLGELGLLPLSEDWRALTRLQGERDKNDPLAHEELKILARDQAAAREMLGLLDGLARTGRLLGDPTLDPGAFVQVLGEAIAEDRLPVRGARGGQVVLLPFGMLPGRRFEHLFIMGLNEGDLPKLHPSDPLFSDALKSQYNESPLPGFFLDTALTHQRQEAGQLLLAVCVPESGLTLSWSKQASSGRERLPSPWIDDIFQAMPNLTLECLPGNPIPPLEHCHTPRDLERRLSLSTLSPDSQDAEKERLLTLLNAANTRWPERWQAIQSLVEVEAERLKFFLGQNNEGNSFVGNISDEYTKKRICSRLSGSENNPLSANQLEQWATCGFKYFANRILKVEFVESQGEDLDLRQAGTLLHSTLQRLYLDLQGKGLLPVRGANLSQALDRISHVLEVEGDTWKDTQPFTHAGLFELKGEKMASQLGALLRFEATANDADGSPENIPTPMYFERSFGVVKEGVDSLAALRIPSKDGQRSVYIRGMMDRIDKVGDGHRVIDYKSGGSAAQDLKLKADRILKTDLQLPIYALALKQTLDSEHVDGVFYGMRDASKPFKRSLKEVFLPKGRKKPILSGTLSDFLSTEPQTRQSLRENDDPNLPDRIWEIVDGMESGTFLVKPESCKFCDFKGACRVMNLIDGIEEGN